MKKVKLIVINPFEDLNLYEHRPRQEAQYFKNKGCDVEILTLQRKVMGNYVFKNTIDGIPAKHFLCKTKRMNRLLKNNWWIQKAKPVIYGFWFLKYILWLKKELKKSEKYYLIAHNIEMAFAMILAGKKNDVKVFVMRELYEGQVSNKLKSKCIWLLSHFIQNRSDYLVHVVPYQRQVTSKRNVKKILYIPNYPVKKNYYGIEKSHSDKLRINYIGYVRDEKSLKMLMDAAKDMKDVEIGIHGEGEAYPYLKSIQGNYNNVQITGYYDYYKETKKLFSQTDIIYCTYDLSIKNRRMAYPIKLYEAIATNTPVLLCKGMAPESFVEKNGYGFVFDYNVKALRKCIDSICSNRDILDNMVDKMQKKVNVYFWENVVEEYDRVLTE